MGLARTTIVGGRPPKEPENITGIPVGLEHLIKTAAANPDGLAFLLNDPLGYAETAGVTLHPSERAILEIIDLPQLQMLVEQIKPQIPDRRRFLRRAAGILGVLGMGIPGLTIRSRAGYSSAIETVKKAGQPGRMARQLPLGFLPGVGGPPEWLPVGDPMPVCKTESRYPTMTPGITPTPTATPTETPTQSNTPTATHSATPTPCPGITPTPTVYPTVTPGITPTPTYTSEPPTVTPGITPSPTPTATPEIGAYIEMPAHFYRSGDECWLRINLFNPGETRSPVPLFVVLQVGTYFYCGPDWSRLPEISHYRIPLPEGWSNIDVIGEFVWPTDAGEMNNLYFWSGLTDDNLQQALGHVDSWKFGFSE